MSKSIVVLFFLFNSLTHKGQDTLFPRNSFEPSLNLHLGHIPKTYPIAPKTNYCFLSSVGFMWKLNGKKNWHQLYRFPKAGIEFFLSDFGNPNELGYSLGFVPSMEVKTKKVSKHFFAKYGLGFAYFNKFYNLGSNPQNYYIGSNITAMVSLNFMWKYNLYKNTQMTFGLSAFHYSNGHTQLPNVGINLIVAHLGFQFDKVEERKFWEMPIVKQKLSYTIKFGLGRHEFGATEKAVGGPKYNSYHLSAWINKPYGNIHLWQTGITAAYYQSFYDYIVSQEIYTRNQQLNACTGLIFAGHEFVFGKWSLMTQLGIYLYNPFFVKQKKLDGTWSDFGEKLESINTNRFGLIYYPFKKSNSLNNIKRQFHMGVIIKANLFQADLFEYNVGYTF